MSNDNLKRQVDPRDYFEKVGDGTVRFVVHIPDEPPNHSKLKLGCRLFSKIMIPKDPDQVKQFIKSDIKRKEPEHKHLLHSQNCLASSVGRQISRA